MVQYIITPWNSPSQLLQTRAHLYPPPPQSSSEKRKQIEEMRTATQRVGVWVQRGNCPHLVESTAILRSAWLNDVGGRGEGYCVRAAYAGAFSRFVTGLLDSHQDKRRKLSMYSIAKTLGLPATYVELRHQATHEVLPSLPKLRTATQKALKWIWGYYWVHLTPEPSASKSDGCLSFVKSLVEENDDRKRAEMEEDLGRWSTDEILNALVEIHGETEGVDVLLRIVKLESRVLDGKAASENGEAVGKSIEDVRAEMERMEWELNARGEIMTRKDVEMKEPESERDSSGKGWTLWEGPWIPKAIGVV